jgi:hypothetical protein
MRATIRTDALLIFLLVYGAASLFHHIHNAAFLSDYPNMPTSLSPARVYAAWVTVTAVGVVGYCLVRWRYQLTGLAVLAIYGVLGLDGLGHYLLAPLRAHTFTMNVTIWLEVATAALLLAAVAGSTLKLLRDRRLG